MPTALEAIHSLGEKQGGYVTGVTTSAASDTQSIVCSTFVNTNLVASEFANYAALIETGACAGEMGFVTSGGLTRSTGTIATADAFSSAIQSGVTFSLYDRDRLPPLRELARPGLMQILNQVLQRFWIERTVSIAGVSGQIHYTVDPTLYPWWSDDLRIIAVQEPVTNSDYVPTVLPPEAWEWVSDGETRKLRFPGAPFTTGQTFTVKVNAPATSRLKLNARLRANLTSTAVSSVTVMDGGYYTALPTIAPASGAATFTAVMAATPGPITSVTVGVGGVYTAGQPPALTVTRNASDTGWADQSTQTAGMVTLTDECVPDVRFLRTMGMSLVYSALAEMAAPGQTVAEWLAKAKEWEAAAVGLRNGRAPRDRTSGVIRLRSSALGGVPASWR